MQTTLKCLLALVLSLIICSSNARAEISTTQVARQFREYCLHETTDRGERLLDDVEIPKTSPDEAEKLVASLREDGTWADIDYQSNARSAWPPCTHLTRALGLTVFAQRVSTSAEARAKCLAAVHRALTHWRDHDYRCVNWWYNDIGVPKILGTMALLLGDELTDDEKNFIAGQVLARSKVGAMTGQNRVWLAANGVMRAALLADDAALRQAVEVIHDELRVGPGEGIQPDASFHQHGPQQQFGNYGMAYAVEMSRWATILRGTPGAFPEAKMSILRRYLLDGENWVVWRGTLDISACGRQIFPGSPHGKARVLRGVMRVMALADAAYAHDYLAFIARNEESASNELIGNHYFWRSDGMVHRRPSWMASLKMSSNRVIGGETVNNENLSGLQLADGATFFYRTGHEYDDVFPVWNWRMVPGVTASLRETSLRWPKADLGKGSPFVGGVSDGTNGGAVMDFRRDDLHARKSWFFVGDTVVCLGADITSGGPAVTTINQCLLKTPVAVQRAGRRESFSGVDQPLEEVDWTEHDGLRYTRLGAETWWASAAEQTGGWRQVFDTPATPKDDVSQKIFKLWITHGGHPGGATYAYSVAPVEAANQPSVKILSNDARLQAIRVGAEKDGWLGAAFWTAGRADLAGLAVAADAPCLLLIDSRRITVSDPTQKLATLRLEIGGRSLVIDLPQGESAGQSVIRPQTP